MERLKNLIGEELVAPESAKYLLNYDPSIGEAYSEIPDSDEKDVTRAVAAAKQAFKEWSAASPEFRGGVLRKLATLIERDLKKLAKAESIDNGKPYSLALGLDIPRSAQNFSFFADAITQFSSEFHEMSGSKKALNYTLRSPLGVVGCISPWNLPLYLFTWKIAPALAAGNTVVAKPSEVTPMTAYLLSELCVEAGMPPGVLNIVHGLGPKVGSALTRHPDVKAVSFTGSTATGSKIAQEAATTFKKVSLEMGGKNPNIIFADCDFEKALASTVKSSFLNQGQICLCGSRIYVERPIYEKFKTALIEKARALKVGDPLVEGTDQGALVSKLHFEKVLSHLEVAKQEGGKILVGGDRAKVSGRCEKGWFVQPTLIEGLPPQCRTNQEEIFGPVATLTLFDREEEVIEMANGTRYGLAASLWTQDVSRAHRVASKIHSGIVWINCWMLRDLRTPFGGVKDSGVGREGGQDALRFFTESKNVCLEY
ncbi:aldehyde dehydrogenase [bacterium]|nr:aldehyde dehydrogenase [bacterium]